MGREVPLDQLPEDLKPGREVPADMLPDEVKPESQILRKVKAFGGGVSGMVEGAGGSAAAAGELVGSKTIRKAGQAVTDYGKKMSEFYKIEDPTFADSVASAAASGATFFIPGMGISKGMSVLSFAPKFAALFGAAASSALESSIEAGSVYNTMLEKGQKEDALKAAEKTFGENIALNTALNYGGGLFNKVLPGSAVGGVKGAIKSGARAAGAEGLQEGAQQVISNVATGEPTGSGVAESVAIGGIVGGGMSVGMDVLSKGQGVKATDPKKSKFDTDVLEFKVKNELGLKPLDTLTPEIIDKAWQDGTLKPKLAEEMGYPPAIQAREQEIQEAGQKAVDEILKEQTQEKAQAEPQAAPEAIAPAAEQQPLPHEQTQDQFVDSVQTGMPAEEQPNIGEIIGVQQAAKEAASPNSMPAIEEFDAQEPEAVVDMSFNPAEFEAPAGETVKATHPAAMTVDEFKAKFPNAPEGAHVGIVRSALKTGRKVPEKVLKEYKGLDEEVMLEMEAENAPATGKESDILQEIRKLGGIQKESLDKYYKGELGAAVKNLNLVRAKGKGGMNLDDLANSLTETGHLAERDVNLLIDRITDATFEKEFGKAKAGVFEQGPAPKSVDFVRQDIKAQLQSVGQSETEAAANAELVARYVDAEAKRRGITPEQFYNEKRRIVVERGEPVAKELKQDPIKTDAPEFKAWFGNSKVVDAQGKPMVVYHGSPAEFTEFDASKIGTLGTSEGKGFYFTSKKQRAEGYKKDGGKVYEVMLSIRKPMSLTQRKITKSQLSKIFIELEKSYPEALSNYGDISYEGKDKVLREAVDVESSAESDVDLMASLMNGGAGTHEAVSQAVIKITGYDGVIADWEISGKGTKGEKVYVAFLPTQIKSVNNRGTFDPKDPNILRQETRASIDVAAHKITLGKYADKSSVAHELAHDFLQDMANFVKSGDAGAQYLAFWKPIEKWLNIKDGKITRSQHEQFARGFEQWLRTGEAPNNSLDAVFRTFQRWLSQVYRKASDLNVVVPAPVQEFFKEMLDAESTEIGSLVKEAKESAITEARNKQVSTKEQLFFKYGSRVYPVKSVNEASAMWDDVRDSAMREGGRPDDQVHTPLIVNGDGKVLGHISWNGRVWRGPDTAGMAEGTYKRVEWVDEPGKASSAQMAERMKPGTDPAIKVENPEILYQEAIPQFMNPEDFMAMLKAKKLAPGKDLTLRVTLMDDALKGGKISRGQTVKLVDVDMADQRFLVEKDGQYTLGTADMFKETYEKPLPPAKPLNPKEAIARATGLKDMQPKVALSEMDLLKEKFKNQVKGASYGVREGARRAKAELLEKMQDKDADIKAIRKEITDYVTANIPAANRGKFITIVRDAKSIMDLAKAVNRVDLEAAQVYRKGVLADIKKVINRSLESSGVEAAYKKKIRELLEGIELQGHRESTITRLQDIKKWVGEQRRAGTYKGLPADLIDEMLLLARRPVSEMPDAALEELLEKVKIYEDLGRVKQASKENVWEIRKAYHLQNLLAGKGTGLLNLSLEALKRRGAFDFAVESLASVMPMDVVFDIIDGNMQYQGPHSKIKNILDGHYGAHLSFFDEHVLPVVSLAKAKGLNEDNFNRIGIYAAARQEGGAERVIEGRPDLTLAEVQSLKLTPAEMEVYQAMRETMDSTHAQVADVNRRLYNRELGKVDDYFSFQTDYDLLNDLEMDRRLNMTPEEFNKYSKSVKKGWTNPRVKNGKGPIKVNAFDIYINHLREVSYFVNMQEPIKMFYEVFNTPEYRERYGVKTAKHTLSWMNLLAKAGRPDQNNVVPILDWLRVNLGRALLGFKATSFMIQVGSMIDAMALIGGRNVTEALTHIVSSKGTRKWLLDNFPELKARVGDDIAFMDLSSKGYITQWEEVKKSPKKIGKYIIDNYPGASMWPIKKMDTLSASAAVLGSVLKKQGTVDISKPPSPELIEYATLMMRRTQSSSFSKDLGLAFSVGGGRGGYFSSNVSINKAILQFRSFILNRFSMLAHDIPQLESKADQAWAYAYVAAAVAAETGIRWGAKASILALLGASGLAVGRELSQDEFWDDFRKNYFKNALDSVPFVSDVARVLTWGNSPVPVLDAVNKAIAAPKEIMRAKGDAQALKAITTGLSAIGSLMGIAGTSQAFQIINNAISRKRLMFPFSDELNKNKDIPMSEWTPDERMRWRALNAANERWKVLNSQYKAAIERGDWDRARVIVDKAKIETKAVRDADSVQEYQAERRIAGL